MAETIVIALGGNALQMDGEAPTYANQVKNVTTVVDGIIELIKQGKNIIISHGNGPQVGRILLQQEASDSEQLPANDLEICVAMSQASIGITIQQVLEERLKKEGINRGVATILTEVLVDANDPAFSNPTKPIGQFYNEEEAKRLEEEKGFVMKKDVEGRYRRVVGSPKPQKILQLDAIKTLVDNNFIVVCCGGGGVPVIEKDGNLTGIAGVIDKDNASSLLAQDLDADKLVILTAVPEVCLNYNTPDQVNLHETTIKELENNMDQFEKGSMLPKVEACLSFTGKTGKESIITNLESVTNALTTRENGTIIKK